MGVFTLVRVQPIGFEVHQQDYHAPYDNSPGYLPPPPQDIYPAITNEHNLNFANPASASYSVGFEGITGIQDPESPGYELSTRSSGDGGRRNSYRPHAFREVRIIFD